jgi:hypothetical protein
LERKHNKQKSSSSSNPSSPSVNPHRKPLISHSDQNPLLTAANSALSPQQTAKNSMAVTSVLPSSAVVQQVVQQQKH